MLSRFAVLLSPLILFAAGAHAKLDKTDACVQALAQGTYVSEKPAETPDLLQIAKKAKVRYLLLTLDFSDFRARVKRGRTQVSTPTLIPIFDSLLGTPVPELMASSYVTGPRGQITPPGQWRVGFLFDADLLLRFDATPVPAMDQREQELVEALASVAPRRRDGEFSWIERENRYLELIFEVMTNTRRARAMQIHFLQDLDLRAAKAVWIPKPAEDEISLPQQDMLIGLGMKTTTPVLDLYEQVPPMTYFAHEIK